MAKKKSRKNLDNLKNLLDFFENLNYNLDSQKKANNPRPTGRQKGSENMKAVKITIKGRALTAAVESGLIRRKLSGDIPMRKFERFWALFSPWLSTDAEQGDDLYQMVEAPADSAADDEKQEVTPE